MKTALFILLGLGVVVAVAALVFYIAGARMPREHRSVVTVRLPASRPAVWAAITDYAAMPGWWPGVQSIRREKLPDGTELTWHKNSHGREMAFRTGESRPNEKLVRIVVGENLPFGGTWTFALADAPAGGGTQLTLTEDGFVNPTLLRPIAKWFIGHDATQRDFIAYLEKHLAHHPPSP